MHQSNRFFNVRLAGNPDGEASADNFLDLEQLLAMARRQAKTVAITAAAGLLLGVVYIIFATPNYTAATSILLDDSLGKFADEVSPAPANMQTDTIILSQIAILKSSELAEKVVRKERLDENDTFMNPPRSIFSGVISGIRTVIGFFNNAKPTNTDLSAADMKREYAAALLQSGLDVERQGRSFVIDLTFTSNDAELAGRIAKAYADVYLSDQLDANFDATQRATIWLQGRLNELKANSQAAALEVERFRAANGLTAAKGALVSEQQLSDINSQLILAQADTARALALYNQYKSILNAGPEGAVNNAAVISDQGGTSVIGTLRARYLTITKREQEIVSRFGQDHPQAVSLRTEEQDVARQIFQELQQVTESYRNQYEAAQSRETSLREGLNNATGKTSMANEALVHLKELEQNSQALSNLYQTYLTRYQEASQQQSFPIAKARVISVASTPTDPSSPKRKLALAASLLLGLFAGGGLGAWREYRERFFRVGEDVRALLGVKFLGYVPKLDMIADEKNLPPPSEGQAPVARTNITRLAVDNPSSLFAETLRNVKIAADVVLQGKQSKVLGIISVLPHEGKTTLAANFAGLLAAKGAKTLLIDGDLRNPGLSRRLSLSTQKGLVKAVMDDQPWQNSVIIDNKTKLAIIPSVLHRNLPHSSEILSSQGMKKLVDEARSIFEYIIIDLPPLGPVVDAKAFAPMADGFVMVAEWGVTPRALVKSVMQSETEITPKVLGLVLNKVDTKRLAKYSSYGSSEHFMERYSSYYIDQA
ncbi:MAG: polysaccharide biosynthesis tyrosine autokinase [Phyllobacterium sp.]|uniref:polysaccharide biosynthesis tyrosine autokinase n=1 Tax=Phyllobacterium sp. TaxID=1871046 RepID=UPI0030F0C2D4